MKKFLGDSLYRLYRVVLKLILSIIPTVTMGIFFIKQLILFNFKSEEIVLKVAKLSTGLIVVAIQSMICCLVGLTIIFILMRLCSFPSHQINVDSLENYLFNKRERSRLISHSNSCFNMIGIVVLVWVLCFQPHFIASYQVVDGTFQMVEPLFNESVLRNYHPLIFTVYGLGLVYYGFQLRLDKWSFNFMMLRFVYKVSAYLLFCAMLLNQSLFNEQYFTTLFAFSHLNWTMDWYVLSRFLIVSSLLSLISDLGPWKVKDQRS